MEKFKTFWKDTSGLIGKMIINQIGIMVFGFIVCTATIQNTTLLLCASLFSVAFYLVLLYVMAWEFGAKRHAGIEAGRLDAKPFWGVKISLVANAVNLAAALTASVAKLVVVAGTPFSFFTAKGADIVAATGPSVAYDIYAVALSVGSFLQVMYMGITHFLLPNCPLHLFLIVLPAVAASELGYYLGTKEYKLWGLLLGNRKKQS